MVPAEKRLAKPIVRMARVYRSSLDPQNMHAHLLHTLDVGYLFLGNIGTTGFEKIDALSRDNVTHMKIRIRIGAVLLAATFFATFFAILFGCYPIEKHWQINPDPGSMLLRRKQKYWVFSG